MRWNIKINVMFHFSVLFISILTYFSSSGGYFGGQGPVGNFKYAPNQYNHMGLIAGGTGLTPCLQVIRCVFEGKDYAQDKCKFTLYYQNR